MPEIARVINGMECCTPMLHNLGEEKSKCRECPYRDDSEEKIRENPVYCVAELFDDAAALVMDYEKAISERAPVKPIVDVDEYRCGVCGHKLEHQEMIGDQVLFHEIYNYCPNCGTEVKRET